MEAKDFKVVISLGTWTNKTPQEIEKLFDEFILDCDEIKSWGTTVEKENPNN